MTKYGDIIRKYERSIFIECTCKNTEELPLDESQPIKITGKPKLIAEGKCSNCGKEIRIFTTVLTYNL